MSKAPKSTKVKKSSKLPKSLTQSQVYSSCQQTQFKFKTTKDLPVSHDIISQDRAISAINAGLGIRRPGYNIYVAGIEGTGKTSVIQTFLQNWAAKQAGPSDWVYLYNFSDHERPTAPRASSWLG